ncbi:hypothetical protein CRG98_010215 [Punica granatum]|uniref:Uncharacterized protein n=1 Tax=Punica granatum TaxID=22663 RepID=A0A2I0KLP0_PUNGR|nr:hypothetical protein CRG98_010215 [Punica granatum]
MHGRRISHFIAELSSSRAGRTYLPHIRFPPFVSIGFAEAKQRLSRLAPSLNSMIASIGSTREEKLTGITSGYCRRSSMGFRHYAIYLAGEPPGSSKGQYTNYLRI